MPSDLAGPQTTLNLFAEHTRSSVELVRQSLNVFQLPPTLSTCRWKIPIFYFRSHLLPLKSIKSLAEVMGPPHAVSNGELAAPLIGAMIASAFVTLFVGLIVLAYSSLFHRMYGTLICQTAWYFRAFPKDPLYLKILVSGCS
jgi:hypothetical protein